MTEKNRYHLFLIFDNESGAVLYEKSLSEVGASILSNMDPLVIGSFISAISSFSKKMTFLSDIRTISFNQSKITFVRTDHHVFVLISATNEPDADLLFKIKVLSSVFESEYLYDLEESKATSVVKQSDFANFDPILFEVLSGTTRELPKNVRNALELALKRVLRRHEYLEELAILTFTGEKIVSVTREGTRFSSNFDYSRILSILYLKNVVDTSYISLRSQNVSVVAIQFISGMILLARLHVDTNPHEIVEELLDNVVPELMHFFE